MRSPPRSRDRPYGRPWTPREALAAAFFLSYLAVQTTVPLVQLLEPGPRRFAWQMYSRVGNVRPDFFLLFQEGVQSVDLERHVSGIRSEIDLARNLPPHLCVVYPAAKAIRIRDPAGPVSLFDCSRADG